MKNKKTQLQYAGDTDVGPVRSLNEDSFYADPELGLFLVADGMGGHDAGEVASAKAIEIISEYVRSSFVDNINDEETLADLDDNDATLVDEPNPAVEIISTAIQKANQEINRMNNDKGYPDGSGMGTTIVGVWLHQDCEYAITFHVGDSRIYRFRDNQVKQLSRDHTLYQFWMDNGQRGDPPTKNIILKAIGPWAETSPDVHIHGVANDDLFMVCSDGLTGPLNDDMIKVLLQDSNDDYSTTCKRLINLANKNDGSDNVTVIIVKCTKN